LKNKTIILALVAARKDSKEIKNKNLLKIGKKSIVSIATSVSLKIKIIDYTILSSDSPKILDLVKNNKKIFKIKRSSFLARDNTPMLPVMKNAISCFENKFNRLVSSLIILDPTSPLRQINDVKNAIKIFKNKKLDLLVSVNKAEHNPYFSIVEKKGNYFSLCKGNNLNIGSRQKAKKVFNINTVVWIYSRKAIMDGKKRIPFKTDVIIIPEKRTLELNTKQDLSNIRKHLKEIR